MQTKQKQQKGFTIVELLIVIVVIAILAAITIVAFNGIQDRARVAATTSEASQVAKKLKLYRVENGAFPTSLSEIGVSDTATTDYEFWTAADNRSFCVSAESGDVIVSIQDNTEAIKGDCAQVVVDYFNNVDLAGSPSHQTTTDLINFNWGGNSPHPGIVSADNFSARWTTSVIPPESGTYTFYTLVDDWVRLYVDGNLLIDGWGLSWGEKSGTVALTANEPVPIVMETRENGGGAQAWLSWSYGAQAKVVIPSSAYIRTN